MTIKDFFNRENTTIAEFSVDSGIPESTLGDILTGTTDLRFCQARTINKLSKALCMNVDDILRLEPVTQECWIPDPVLNPVHKFEKPLRFAAFRKKMVSEIAHKGEEEFVLDTLRCEKVEDLYCKTQYPEALYLIGLLDYLAAKNDILRITRYDRYRAETMKGTIFAPMAKCMPPCADSVIMPDAIPQLLKFNFIELPNTFFMSF